MSKNFFKRVFRFIKVNAIQNPRFLLIYAITYFLPGFSFNVCFYDGEEVKKLIEQGKSIIRFGDGEIYLMNGGSLGDHTRYDPRMRKIFFDIIKKYRSDSPYVLGIAEFTRKTNRYLREKKMLHVWLPMKVYYFLYFSKNTRYADAHAFYYNDYFPRFIAPALENRYVIFISRKKNIETLKANKEFISRHGSYFIETPDHDAYDMYDQIVEKADHMLKTLPQDKKPIIVAAFGPASKVFAYDFSRKGIQILDIGTGIEILYSDKKINVILPENSKK